MKIAEVRDVAARYGIESLRDDELKVLLKDISHPHFNQRVAEYHRRVNMNVMENLRVSSSRQLFEAVTSKTDLAIIEREKFVVLALTRRYELISVKEMFAGGMEATVADPKTIFKYLLSVPRCCAFAVSHNHPSGNLTPSDADHRLTKKLKEGSNLLDFIMLDHVIIAGHDRYYSFADEGQL